MAEHYPPPRAPVTSGRMRLRTAIAAISVAVASLALAAPAFAAKNGEGLAGETNDKVVTYFCLGVVIFFVVLVTVGSLIQGHFDKRKDAKKAARIRQRVGW
jgi:hypothetical protein